MVRIQSSGTRVKRKTGVVPTRLPQHVPLCDFEGNAMRIGRKQLTVMIACGAMALLASITAKLTANQASAPVSAQSATPAAPTAPARELVKAYCVSCHNERARTANLMLDKADTEQPANSAETWEKVIVKLRSRAMPPPGVRRPDNATYDQIANWLESELDRAAAAHVNPGLLGQLHRLNRTEYAN